MACVVASQDLRTSVVYTLRTLAIAACYYAAGRLGLTRELVIEGAVVSPIWPPTGVAVAALLVFGLRYWPGIALGALGVLLSLTSLTWRSFVILAGNTAAPVCGCLLLRAVGFRTDLARLRDGVALVFLGALAAMLVSSSVAAGLLISTGELPGAGFWEVWLAWWVGDAMGVLIVTPVLLVLHRLRGPWRWSRWKEALGLTVVAAALVPLATRIGMSVLFLVYPLLIWAALRFQLAGSMACAMFASVMATIAATDRVGPFERLSREEVLINLQAFNGAVVLTALLLSALITEQRSTRRSVERACQELVEVLEHLTAGETASGRPPLEEAGARWATDDPDWDARSTGEWSTRRATDEPP
ncbi:MASE1 domain-containing protein [Streptomyces sp. NEAU-W12]|uniref:MASE1 domain-containing protein n=1 Tax=Streptomyces sp. NEAU-W12 TaxID=2994668 RepID=UPI00224B1BF2|nr:MASE1 domain-containing protein [Streptomyces sp. NEAU-W12]MCX2927106.1 MASE1 domain-containing protein [Streptomyces sp. NEAU-W12]